MLNRLLMAALLAPLLAGPGFAAPSPTQLFRLKNSDFPERGHFVPTLASSNGTDNFETCSGEYKTLTEADVDPDDGDCNSDPLSPSLPQAYIGKPVYIGGIKVGIVNAFAIGKEGQWEGLIIDPSVPLAPGTDGTTGVLARMQDWTLGPFDGNYSVMLDKPLTDLQMLSLGNSKG